MAGWDREGKAGWWGKGDKALTQKKKPFCWSLRLHVGSDFCISVTASEVWKTESGFSAKAHWTQQLSHTAQTMSFRERKHDRQAQEMTKRWQVEEHTLNTMDSLRHLQILWPQHPKFFMVLGYNQDLVPLNFKWRLWKQLKDPGQTMACSS